MRLSWMFARVLAAGMMLLSVGAVGLAGCGEDRSTDLSGAESFRTYAVYYAGPEVEGFDLSDIVEENYGRDAGGTSRWSFFYGDCTPSGSEGGCPLPLEIQNFSICRRWPGAYPWPVPLVDFKGAKLARRAGATIEIYTGRTAVAIFSPKRRAMTAAKQLRVVGQQKPAESLPPPAKGSLTGNFDCAAESG
jgi:hypothetical protein